MTTLEQLIANARAELDEPITSAGLERVIRSTINRLGMCVNSATGEVYDPAPKPVINFPHDQNVRYRGQRRRKGFRR